MKQRLLYLINIFKINFLSVSILLITCFLLWILFIKIDPYYTLDSRSEKVTLNKFVFEKNFIQFNNDSTKIIFPPYGINNAQKKFKGGINLSPTAVIEFERLGNGPLLISVSDSLRESVIVPNNEEASKFSDLRLLIINPSRDFENGIPIYFPFFTKALKLGEEIRHQGEAVNQKYTLDGSIRIFGKVSLLSGDANEFFESYTHFLNFGDLVVSEDNVDVSGVVYINEKPGLNLNSKVEGLHLSVYPFRIKQSDSKIKLEPSRIDYLLSFKKLQFFSIFIAFIVFLINLIDFSVGFNEKIQTLTKALKWRSK